MSSQKIGLHNAFFLCILTGCPGGGSGGLVPPEFAANFGLSLDAVGKNFLFNHHIFKPRVGFLKVETASDETENNFGGETLAKAFCQKFVVITKFAVFIIFI